MLLLLLHRIGGKRRIVSINNVTRHIVAILPMSGVDMIILIVVNMKLLVLLVVVIVIISTIKISIHRSNKSFDITNLVMIIVSADWWLQTQ